MERSIAESKQEIAPEIIAAKTIIESILRAKKTLRLYPRTNPIYEKNLEGVVDAFMQYYQVDEKLTFKFGRDEIYCDSEPVYKNTEREGNIALLFFKDGIREMTFYKDITRDEIEDFLNIIALDFDKEAIEDDIVTLLWQRDFKNIDYIAKDTYLADEDGYEADTINDLKQDSTNTDDLKKAYEEIIDENEVNPAIPIIPLTEDDMQEIQNIIKRDDEDKLPKFFSMLFEIFYDVERSVEYDDILSFFIKSIEYAVRNKRFQLLTDVIVSLKKIIIDKSTDEDMRKSAIKIVLFIGGKKIISIIGEFLDSGEEIEKTEFEQFAGSLDKTAISPFMGLLNDLQNMHARRTVINALVSLGPKDMSVLLKGLNNPQWYVVRNVIYVLRLIGDKTVLGNVAKTIKHTDSRVRREAVRTLGDLGRDNILKSVEECLDDEDIKVRKAALVAMGNIATESAQKVLIQRINHSSFSEKDVNEKKEYFGNLARWTDDSVFKFYEQIIIKKSFWKKTKHNETKACAAYGLGMLGDKRALPILSECLNTGNQLLEEFASDAIKRINNAG